MALVACVTYDTPENNRHWMTRETINSLFDTVDTKKHDIYIVDNGSTSQDTIRLLNEVSSNTNAYVIFNQDNIGTARAVNKAWECRKSGQHCLKIDNDVTISQIGWLDTLEECLEREPSIGCLGLKRSDLGESPHMPVGDFLHSELVMLPHKLGERWLVVEVVRQVLATCCLYSSKLLDKIGYLYQPTKYAWDDALAAVRCEVAGMCSAFFPTIEIKHLDPGGDAHCKWKVEEAERTLPIFAKLTEEYRTGKRPIYHGPMDE